MDLKHLEFGRGHKSRFGTDFTRIAAATTRAAEALGISDETGSITPGLSADLVALEGDPLTDVEAYFRPRAVVVRGTVVPLGLGWQRAASSGVSS